MMCHFFFYTQTLTCSESKLPTDKVLQHNILGFVKKPPNPNPNPNPNPDGDFYLYETINSIIEYSKGFFTLKITYMLFLTLGYKIKILPIITIGKLVPALNWAKCLKLFFSRQSAINYFFLKTSRILRDYTPSFICYINHIDNKHLNKLKIKNTLIFCKKNFIIHNTKINSTSIRHFNQLSLNQLDNNLKIKPLSDIDKFSYYLTGLIEGDGTIIVPKTLKTKNRINYPCIQIVFNLKDLPLALLIKKELNQGSLSRKKGINAYVLTINSYLGLLYLISLINGKMKTPKIYSLFNLID